MPLSPPRPRRRKHTQSGVDVKPQEATNRLGSAAALGAVASVASILASIIRSKVAAIYLGPEGVGIVAEIQQLTTLALVPAAALVGPALIQALANEAKSDEEPRSIRASLTWLAIAAATIGIGVSALSSFVLPSNWGAGKEHWVALAVLGGLGASAMTVPTALLFFEARLMESTKAQIATAVLTTVAVVALTPRFGVPGQLAATAAAPFLLLPFVARVARKSRLWPSTWRPAPDTDYLSRALKLGATSLVSGLSMQGALYFIRLELEAFGGAELNGQFQASWAIGSIYLGVLLGGLASYVFPRYARAESETALQWEVDEAARFMSNLAPPLVLIAVAFSGIAVSLLYSTQFAPAAEMLTWQLSGDAAKCLSWVYAGPLLYRGRVRAYITTELLGAALFATTAFFLLRVSGVTGVGQAYFVTYVLYLPLTAIVLRLSCRVRARTRDLATVGAVTTILGILSSSFAGQPLVRAGLVLGAAGWIWRSGQARTIWEAVRSKLIR